MSDSTLRPIAATVTAVLLGAALGLAAGWTTLVLGGHTDNAGRLGFVTGGSTFILVSTGWGRGRRGWLWGLAAATVVGGLMLVHFWTRIGHP